jgi:hypothetical protein
MNRVSINGVQLKVVHYNGPLWRADYSYMKEGTNARTNYAGAEYKYFTLSRDELGSYTRRGMTHIKRWQSRRPLVLIDIMDKTTHSALKRIIGEDYLRIPLPLNKNGRPYRVSEENTAKKDDEFLGELCKLGLDGYYMIRQEARNGVDTFHSEVGLCSTAFSDLELMDVSKANNAPALKRNQTKKSRFQLNNAVSPPQFGLFNTNNSRTNSIRRPRFNNESNTNNAMSLPKRRRINTKKNNTMRQPLFF